MARIIHITDFDDPALDVYARLTEGQLLCRADPEQGLFIAESPNVILRALDGGYEPVSLLMEEKHIAGQAAEVVGRCGDVPLYTAPLDVLTQLTGFPLTRGVLCAMRRRPPADPAALCKQSRRIAILEDVMNPTNLGAIFRSAAALGMDAVLLTPGCCDPLYRRCARVSMGTVFQIPWAYITPYQHLWPQAGLAWLRGWGYETAAMALRNNTLSVTDSRLRGAEKLAVLLGTEGDGLREETIAACDYTVKIPMSHAVDSLNVAAASAVIFWELSNKEE